MLGFVLLSRLATESIVARLVHRLEAEDGLIRYDAVAARGLVGRCALFRAEANGTS